MLTNDTILKNNKLSGYITYDPLSHTKKYNELDVRSGVLEFLNLVYIYIGNRR